MRCHCLCLDAPLMHSITVCTPKLLVFDDDLFDAVEDIRDQLASMTSPPPRVSFGVPIPAEHARGDVADLNVQLQSFPTTRPPRSHRAGVKLTDTFALIYTSGAATVCRRALVLLSRR